MIKGAFKCKREYCGEAVSNKRGVGDIRGSSEDVAEVDEGGGDKGS